MHPIQSTIINVSFVNSVKATGYIWNQIQYIYKVNISFGDVRRISPYKSISTYVTNCLKIIRISYMIPTF